MIEARCMQVASRIASEPAAQLHDQQGGCYIPLRSWWEGDQRYLIYLKSTLVRKIDEPRGVLVHGRIGRRLSWSLVMARERWNA